MKKRESILTFWRGPLTSLMTWPSQWRRHYSIQYCGIRLFLYYSYIMDGLGHSMTQYSLFSNEAVTFPTWPQSYRMTGGMTTIDYSLLPAMTGNMLVCDWRGIRPVMTIDILMTRPYWYQYYYWNQYLFYWYYRVYSSIIDWLTLLVVMILY